MLRVLTFSWVILVGTQTACVSNYVDNVVREVTGELSVLDVSRLLVDVSLDLRFYRSVTLECKVRSIRKSRRNN